MLTRIPPNWVISFLLLAAWEAPCQQRPSPDLLLGLEFGGSNSVGVQRDGMRTWSSLPDAPSSVQPPTHAETFLMFVNDPRSPSTFRAVGISMGLKRGKEEHFAPRTEPSFTALYSTAVHQNESSAFWGKFVYPSLLKQDPRYRASTSGSFVGRAADAASRVLIMRDDSGKGRLNTPYFLGVLTSVAIHTAYRPYWARSQAATFNNFGSTIGSDAGLNLFHEFRPGILLMVKGHTPKFVSRIGAPITNAPPRDVVPTPAR